MSSICCKSTVQNNQYVKLSNSTRHDYRTVLKLMLKTPQQTQQPSTYVEKYFFVIIHAVNQTNWNYRILQDFPRAVAVEKKTNNKKLVDSGRIATWCMPTAAYKSYKKTFNRKQMRYWNKLDVVYAIYIYVYVIYVCITYMCMW